MDSITSLSATTLRVSPSRGWIRTSLGLSLIFLFLPWEGWGLWIRPDATALLLIYWGVFEPTVMGAGSAFLLGILSDVAQSHVLGVHALTYSTLYVLVQYYRPRILSFYRLNQVLHVLMLLLLTQWLEGLVNGLLGYSWPNWAWWVIQPLLGALGWPFLPLLLERAPRPAAPPQSP
ncbi:rod shape-determining protein MreD [Ferrovum myxofaciens]|uniref:Rod shape-determining protein MreD n=3 Tax=root TaxID=1 RepID=A0A8F3E4M7_9PROT|nr:rod shape-determining protein MreD [Ferrovum myxofaciens]KXW59400.1 rod shape-determining protein MreD [Ferrovum myxofaciens]MBU6994331.1 rod shape-determining protein MreD [Ferrovum myxofaciens]QKE38231.1 MAG: rod shape-determining protein MreD [Ferrovum myxofaciens]QKE40783.1 MAG: rod shape-determining protein MreD [Ferrovum myxofaciens]QWY75961.1 MAG: rod shape-determining protein MreD [Ferrovum myxofaciens]